MREPIPELDGVRALAIVPVLTLHGTYGNASGGYLGVDLFFVLSGFLITRLLAEEFGSTGGLRFTHFFVRRALRIGPPLLAGVALGASLWTVGDLHQAIPAVLFFYANLIDFQKLGVLAPAWSLSIEEHFYFVWPVAFLTLASRDARTSMRVLLLVAGSAMTLRVLLLIAGADPEFLYRFTLTRVDALAIGCFGALLIGQSPLKGNDANDVHALILFLVLCLAFLFSQKNSTLMLTTGHTAFAIISAGFIASVLRTSDGHPVRQLLSSRVMRYIGRRSYALYMYHLPIFVALESFRKPHDPTNFFWITIARFAITFLVAELSYRVIERPALALKQRYSN
jgi:peptidoglycan/LPS O-acetylase OafA/YrhL